MSGKKGKEQNNERTLLWDLLSWTSEEWIDIQGVEKTGTKTLADWYMLIFVEV